MSYNKINTIYINKLKLKNFKVKKTKFSKGYFLIEKINLFFKFLIFE